MAGDALLDQFQLPKPAPNIYRIGQYTPVSIRDQIVRAMYLVDRLFATRQLGSGQKLLIVGAGAAGVSAALQAANRSPGSVEIVDQTFPVMKLQASSTSRWLCPTQYDWPAGHWADAEWPIPEMVAPRRFTAVAPWMSWKLKAKHASRWASQFQNLLRPLLTSGAAVLTPNTEVVHWVPNSTGWDVQVRDAHSKLALPSKYADVIIFAGGFGGERIDVPLTGNLAQTTFESKPFWSTDTFETNSCGISNLTHGILISGTGDGALQDYVRLVTGMRSAGDVWEVITGKVVSWWTSELEAMWHWEDHARRSAQFAPASLTQCELLERLHGQYEEVIGELVSHSDWAAVERRLDGFLAGRPYDRIWVACKSSHFDQCYALNRAVASILMRYVTIKTGSSPLLKHTAIRSTEAVHTGACTNGCWGQPHKVVLALGVACDTKSADIITWPLAQTRTEVYDGVVIRHGIHPLPIGGATQSLGWQNVPLHLP